MDRNIFGAAMENPWQDREKIPYPRLLSLLPAAIVYLLAVLAPVLAASGEIALPAYVGLCAGVIYLIRMPRIAISVLLASFVPVALLQSFELGVLILGTVAAIGGGALILTALKQPWRAVILPLLAYVIAYAITRDAILSCLTFVTLPASLLLAFATVRGERRTGAICYAVGGMLLSVLILLAIYFAVTYGSVKGSVIVSHFETQREWIVGILLNYKQEMLRLLTEQGMQASEMYAYFDTLMSRDLLVDLVAMVYNVLPAIVIVLCCILAYEAQSLLCGSYCNLGMKQMLSPASVTFTMSTVSAILYLVSFLLSAVLPSGMVLAVVQNFYIILTPGLLLVGYSGVLFRLRTAKGGSKTFLIILLVGLLLINPASIIGLLAFFGAVTVLLSAFGLRLLQKMQNGGGKGDDNGGDNGDDGER